MSGQLYSESTAPLCAGAPDALAPRPIRGDRHADRVMVCLGFLLLLMGWAILYRQTGDGDSITHFLRARDGLWRPGDIMGSWDRVGALLPLLIPAQFGILAARWTSAVISICCLWQTMRMADDLGLKRAILIGPLLILQPLVFTLAGDTMTEIPTALGLVIAIRLWWQRRTVASCLVISYLPLVRPEGFFLCAMWGLMVLMDARIGSLPRRLLTSLSLGAGIIVWALACWYFTGKATYFFREGWGWPADSIPIYGHGGFFSHINRWPIYCGPALLPLFILGLPDELKKRWIAIVAIAIIAAESLSYAIPGSEVQWIRESAMPWVVLPMIGWLAWACRKDRLAILWWAFLLIFTLHTVLWWRGWFGSDGLLRILAVVSPVTAMLCLRGGNILMDHLIAIGWSRRAVTTVALGLLILMFASAVCGYVFNPFRQRIFLMQDACAHARRPDLSINAPSLIFGDTMAVACLDLPPNPKNLLFNVWDRNVECDHLLHAPIGSWGLWDNQSSQNSYEVTLDDLPTLGYTILYHNSQATLLGKIIGTQYRFTKDQTYAVISKVSPGKLPDGVKPQSGSSD